MKRLLTAALLGVALVLAGCGGANSSGPAEGTSDIGVADDEALGLMDPDGERNPDAVLCNRLRDRNPDRWWTLGEFVGQDLVDSCLALYGAKFVGDCLIIANGSCPGADLRQADLRGSRLGGMNLSGANLSGANFSDAFMTFAKLDQADLSGANFSNAQMYGVDLRGATIESANLSGANFHDAIWVDGRKCSRTSPPGRCS